MIKFENNKLLLNRKEIINFRFIISTKLFCITNVNIQSNSAANTRTNKWTTAQQKV